MSDLELRAYPTCFLNGCIIISPGKSFAITSVTGYAHKNIVYSSYNTLD